LKMWLKWESILFFIDGELCLIMGYDILLIPGVVLLSAMVNSILVMGLSISKADVVGM